MTNLLLSVAYHFENSLGNISCIHLFVVLNDCVASFFIAEVILHCHDCRVIFDSWTFHSKNVYPHNQSLLFIRDSFVTVIYSFIEMDRCELLLHGWQQVAGTPLNFLLQKNVMLLSFHNVVFLLVCQMLRLTSRSIDNIRLLTSVLILIFSFLSMALISCSLTICRTQPRFFIVSIHHKVAYICMFCCAP